MFKAENVYSSSTTTIVKIAGQIREKDLNTWTAAISELSRNHHRELVLDFSSVTFIDPSAVRALQKRLNKNTYLLNCSPMVRNMLQTTDFGKNLLG